MEVQVKDGDVVLTLSGRYVCKHGRIRSTRATGWDASKFLQNLCTTRGVGVSDVHDMSSRRGGLKGLNGYRRDFIKVKSCEICEIFCYVCNIVKGMDFKDIAPYIFRTEKSVKYAVDRCIYYMSEYKEYKQMVDAIIEQL